MLSRKDINWIGFKEAHVTICNLKQEVENAEKKLLCAKKAFYESTTKRNPVKHQLVSGEPISISKPTELKQAKQFPHFIKETLTVSPKISSINNEKVSSPADTKEVPVTSEEEPNLMPSKFPHSEPLYLINTLRKSSFDSFLSKLSSEDSFSTSEIKHSSSERTSSLIASTYREANKLFKTHEIGIKETTSELSRSVTTLTSIQENSYEAKKMQWISKSQLRNSENISMEWKEVSANKPFILHNRFKPDNIQKLKDIIDKQKQKQEQYHLQLENFSSSSYEQFELKKIRSIQEPQPLRTGEDDQIAPAPVRKVCTVKSLPIYKGFSAPSQKISTGTRWRKQKNKFTIAKSSNTKAVSFNGPKRIKTVVKCESDFVSASHWRGTEKTEEIDVTEKTEELDKEKALSHALGDDPPKMSPAESLEDKDSGNIINFDVKTDILSILKDQQLSNENSDDQGSAKNETSSTEAKLESQLLKIDNDQNSLKENKKPLKSKTVKRKAKKSPEQKVTSPKIKPYDVDKVRDYMLKKKEERKKRHQEEHRKRIHEAQKRKESLQKLFEYQQQNKKFTTKEKPLSPVKKNDSIKKEPENEHASNISKKEHLLKNSIVENAVSTDEKDISCLNDESSKRKHEEESQPKEISEKNRINVNTSSKRKQENVHTDSVPKFISISVTPTPKHSKIVKDARHLISPEKNPFKRNKSFTQTKNNKPAKSSGRENFTEEIENQNLQQNKDVEMVDIKDSNAFKATDIFRSISTVSTPSTISHLIGEKENKMTEMGYTPLFLPEVKSKKAATLKDLVKCINDLTKPIEPLLRTRKWIEDNPLPPPSVMKKRITENTHLLHQHQHELPVKDTDVENSKSANSKNSSFKEQVSGIGNINQLYVQILGRKSSLESVQNIEKRPTFVDNSFAPHHKENETEDEIIEGTLLSADEYVLDDSQKDSKVIHQSGASSNSSHFSDLQKANVVPDPFNLINTWKRKPLGLTLTNGKSNSTKGVSISSKLSENNIPFEELYKSLINAPSTNFQDKITDSKLTGVSEDSFLSQGLEQSSFTSTHYTNSKDCISGEILSKASNATNFSNPSSGTNSESQSVKSNESLPHKQSAHHSISENPTLNKEKSHENIAVRIDSNATKSSGSSVESNKHIELHKTSADIISLPSNVSEHLQKANRSTSSMSDTIVSGTINSEYTLEVDAEEPDKKVTEEIDGKEMEFHKELVPDRMSVSGSSISEVISVVENSKGFRNSIEDLQSDRIVTSSKHSDVPAENSANDKTSSKSASNKSSDPQSVKSHEQKSTSTNSTTDSHKSSEYSALLLKHDQLQSIPSGSQNSVTIDFRQPLRLTLSNGEAVQSNQGLDLHENQYLHTQVVTRVASEAAAAAATSAVIAVFATQKALLAEV